MLVKLKRSFWGPDGNFFEVRNGAPVEVPDSYCQTLDADDKESGKKKGDFVHLPNDAELLDEKGRSIVHVPADHPTVEVVDTGGPVTGKVETPLPITPIVNVGAGQGAAKIADDGPSVTDDGKPAVKK